MLIEHTSRLSFFVKVKHEHIISSHGNGVDVYRYLRRILVNVRAHHIKGLKYYIKLEKWFNWVRKYTEYSRWLFSNNRFCNQSYCHIYQSTHYSKYIIDYSLPTAIHNFQVAESYFDLGNWIHDVYQSHRYNPHNAELFLFKLCRLKGYYQFEITITVIVSCFWFIWIPTLWVLGNHKLLNYFRAGNVFLRLLIKMLPALTQFHFKNLFAQVEIENTEILGLYQQIRDNVSFLLG